jgi:hypothetical protein
MFTGINPIIRNIMDMTARTIPAITIVAVAVSFEINQFMNNNV